MSTVANADGMTISELVQYIKDTHKKTVNEQTLYKWIIRGRRNKDGHVRFLKTSQMGWSAPHFVTHKEIDSYLKWLMRESAAG